jgi:outer membrane protein TolC
MKWIISAVLGIALVTGLTAPGLSEDRDVQLTGRVAVGDLISYAYGKNPSIMKAREGWKAVLEEYRVTTGYPDPQLKFTYFPEPIETRLGPQDWTASLNQKIPFPGKLTRAGRVVAATAQIARINLDRAFKRVRTAVRTSFFELLYIRKARKTAEENLRLLVHLRKVGETAYAQDRAALMDMVKAQSQLGQLRYDRILLDELELTEQTRLNGLLDRPPDAPFGELSDEAVLPVVYPLKALYHMAETHQESVRRARAEVKKAGAEAELAKYENLPDFNVGVFYSAIGNPDIPVQPRDAGRDALGVQVGITIPLWFDKNRGRTERANARVRMAEAGKTEQTNAVRTRVHQIYFRLQNAKRLITLYGKDLLPQAVKSMEIAETWYREGESSFSDFVETQAVYYNFQLSLVRARADYGKYLALLEEAVGQPVTKKPVTPSRGTEKERP